MRNNHSPPFRILADSALEFEQADSPFKSDPGDLSYLEQTIVVKNQQIEQLLSELQQTQSLHRNLKNKFLADERTMKQSIKSMENAIGKLRRENASMSQKYHTAVEEKKESERERLRIEREWDLAVKAVDSKVAALRAQNEGLKADGHKLELENTRLKEQIQRLLRADTEAKQMCSEKEKKLLELTRSIEQKQEGWSAKEQELRSALASAEQKSNNSKITTLDQLESKIKNIIIDL